MSSLSRVVTWLEAIADRANPILVKETRQALKSRQFVLTFLVVLIACWIASFAVVAIAPNVYYGAEGGSMLIVYCAILAFPLMLIVPYTAYRSLAAEQEDNTYDLLSITTLTTGQIVTGKLGSAVVQMVVYLSAVSPCIAFAFLCRRADHRRAARLFWVGLARSFDVGPAGGHGCQGSPHPDDTLGPLDPRAGVGLFSFDRFGRWVHSTKLFLPA